MYYAESNENYKYFLLGLWHWMGIVYIVLGIKWNK